MTLHPALRTTVTFAATLLVSAAAAAAGIWAVQHWQPRQAAPLTFAAPQTAPAASAAATLHRPPVMAERVTERPAVRAAIWIDGAAAAQGGERLALPDGTAFQVHLQAMHPGLVRLVAENAAGERVTVWQARMEAGETRLSPRLRLTGLRGMERLWLMPEAGPATSFGILHV